MCSKVNEESQQFACLHWLIIYLDKTQLLKKKCLYKNKDRAKGRNKKQLKLKAFDQQYNYDNGNKADFILPKSRTNELYNNLLSSKRLKVDFFRKNTIIRTATLEKALMMQF